MERNARRNELKGYVRADGDHWYLGEKEIAIIDPETSEIEWLVRKTALTQDVIEAVREKKPHHNGKWIVEAKRIERSATQGEILVQINGKTVADFADDKILGDDGFYHSKYADNELGHLVASAFWHPMDSVYHFSDTAKKAFCEKPKVQKMATSAADSTAADSTATESSNSSSDRHILALASDGKTIADFTFQQFDRICEVYDLTLDYCQKLAESDDLEWDMSIFGPIAEFASEQLAKSGIPVRFPSVVSDGENDVVQDYYTNETLAKSKKKTYVFTKKGEKKVEEFLSDCAAMRKVILEAVTDTAFETELPTKEDILSDVNNGVGTDIDGVYVNGWGITDNHSSCYPLGLTLGVDFEEER